LWTKTNGPAQFKIASPSSLSTTISGLVAGTYVFTLKVTDNNGQATSSSKTVNVLALVPPTVSAGPNQTVTLPKDSVILTGTAAGKNGATIKSVKWSQVGGPSADEIYSPNNLSTKLKGLKAGVCKYELSATDNNGITATASVTVTVNPAPPPPPPKETGGGQTSKPVSGGDGKTVNVSIYGGSNPYSDPQWNNWAISTGAATNISSPAFKYSNGNASTISANLSQSTAIADNGTAYAQSGGMAPGGVLRYTSYSTTSRTLTITGLSTAKKYEIDLYASRNLNDGNTTDFVAGGKTGGVSTYNNLNNKAVFTALVPDAQGKVVINISETVTYNYVNGFTLREDTVSSPKYVKVNVYGGANPFNDPQWNNWAISTGASAIMSSSEFRYSDGSASTVWATLTQSTAIADNGVKYALTGAMAPAGVLRYTSYSTVPRNLVISGLSTSKKYDLELYASRDLNKGNNTVFAVPGLNTSVPSYNNLVDKAIFSGLQPNTYGRITISMGTDAGTYNYLNGFVLTEGSSATTAAVNAPQIHAISGQASAEGPTQNSAEGAGDILRIWPNPVQDAFTLELSNEQRGNLQVQIIDRNGSVRKVFNLVKDQTHITQTFSIGGLSPGPYVLKVQNVGWVGVIELVKM
jgi:hypothetical protein